ncbi:deoxyribodipyrimidine photo-lyase [Rhodobacteraceae bacterium 63075]|nr:deoxyribodipyrimidine photo-lyase [Rhodobacteraceae bacterium 63075]
MGTTARIWWIRRDLRLTDNAALLAAAEAGPVIPLFIFDERFEGLGAAPRWRLQEGLRALAASLEDRGSRLILRRGDARAVMPAILDETEAAGVHWLRLYDPYSRDVDAEIKSALREDGYEAESHAGHLLQEPMNVRTQAGEFYKVYTPFWKAIRQMEVPAPMAAPELSAPESWPQSDDLGDWNMASDMQRGADVLARHNRAGEEAARDKLSHFLETRAGEYKDARNMVGQAGTSELSDHLSLGEISPRTIWAEAQAAGGGKGLEHFLSEVGWRDFAHHLMYHTPHMLDQNWREGWDAFPWSEDESNDAVRAWKEGRTGIDFVDAAMRELWVTGKMHNRARMVAASYLTKHMMVHWRVGERWFADQLVDYDPASNAMGWQWVAGSGPDAAPYFRVFNPDTQLSKFDPEGRYVRAWIAEGQSDPPRTALEFFEAVPKGAGLNPGQARPDAPIIGLKEGRERALAAYSAR